MREREPGVHSVDEEIRAFEEHLRSRGLSERTIYEYTHDLHQFLSKYPDPSPEDLESWIGELAGNGLKLSSLQRKFASVRAWARWRKRGDLLSIEWRWGREEKLPVFLTEEEVRRMERAAEEMIDPRYPALITLMSRGGLRLSEVARLKARDVDLKGGVITVRSGKGRKDRAIPIPKGSKRHLQVILRFLKGEDPIFPWSRRTINRIVKRIAEKAGIEKRVTPHTLRHTAATRMLKRGMNIRAVQKVLGHKSLTTTQRYTHLTIEDLKEEMERAGL